MHFAIRYLTEYRYDGPVTDNLNALRVTPATTAIRAGPMLVNGLEAFAGNLSAYTVTFDPLAAPGAEIRSTSGPIGGSLSYSERSIHWPSRSGLRSSRTSTGAVTAQSEVVVTLAAPSLAHAPGSEARIATEQRRTASRQAFEYLRELTLIGPHDLSPGLVHPRG